jgi:hypothetical protein
MEGYRIIINLDDIKNKLEHKDYVIRIEKQVKVDDCMSYTLSTYGGDNPSLISHTNQLITN